LDALRGPLDGLVRLPLHLDASARPLHDLADPRRRRLVYELVLQGLTDSDAAQLKTALGITTIRDLGTAPRSAPHVS